MKNITCNIIEDLLPLYIDGICSDETKEFIESHIENCSDCEQKLELMNTDLPIVNIEENLVNSRMLNKLSDIWIKNVNVNIKASVTTVLFYIFMIGILFLSMYFEKRIHETFMFEYQLANFFIRTLGWLLLGGLIAFFGGRSKCSKKTIILELIIIGIPSLLMTFIFLIYYFIPFRISGFVGRNLTEITIIGGLLLGCEIYRLMHGIRQKK